MSNSSLDMKNNNIIYEKLFDKLKTKVRNTYLF